MLERKKILSLIVLATLLTGTIAGCCNSSKSGSKNNKVITVWSHLMSGEIEELDKVAQKWAEEKGITVKVVDDKGDMQAFIQAANSSQGPDIMFGIANDNLGTFQKAGLLAKVPDGFIDISKYASKQVIDAVTLNGTQYGIPLAQESIGLFYNKDKVKEAPKTMEEVVQMGKEVGFEYAIADFYRSYGFLAADGGYVFKNNNGTLDPNDIGLNNEGAKKGYQFLQDLVVKYNLMTPDINDDIAKGDFSSGKTGFYISGPWDISTFKDAGINFGVVPIPTFGGKLVQTFMGVQAAFVSETSKNKDLSWELMKYLNDNCNTLLIEKGNRIPATKEGLESDTFKNKEFMDQFAKQTENATPLPNIPEVQAMWTPGADGIKALISGQLDVDNTGKQIVEQIQTGISQQK